MGTMIVTEYVIRSICETIEHDQSVCVTLAAAKHHDDGTIMTYKDHLAERLHRRLYKLVIGDLGKREYLLRTCKTWGCQNPYHHVASKRPYLGRASSCPNGHPYTPDNTLTTGPYRCRICAEARLARTRTTSRRWGFCAKGHKLTTNNVYLYTDVGGRVHRRCKRCKKAEVQARRKKKQNDAA
jgi:hypothetical protein